MEERCNGGGDARWLVHPGTFEKDSTPEPKPYVDPAKFNDQLQAQQGSLDLEKLPATVAATAAVEVARRAFT